MSTLWRFGTQKSHNTHCLPPTNNELGCVGLPTMDGNLGNQDSSPALGTGNIPPGTQSLCLSNEGIDQIRNCILVAWGTLGAQRCVLLSYPFHFALIWFFRVRRWISLRGSQFRLCSMTPYGLKQVGITHLCTCLVPIDFWDYKCKCGIKLYETHQVDRLYFRLESLSQGDGRPAKWGWGVNEGAGAVAGPPRS